MKLEAINAEESKPKGEAPQSHPVTKSILGHFFSNKLTGIRKVFNDVMGTKMEKIPKSKFIEFAKKVLNEQKLTDTDIKDLFNYLSKRNKKQESGLKSVSNEFILIIIALF